MQQGIQSLQPRLRKLRYLAQFVLESDQEHADMTSEMDRTIVRVCMCLVKFYGIMAENSMFLSDVAKDALPKVDRILAEQYQKLSSWAHDALVKFWK